MESASRHGLSTYVALFVSVITGIIPFIGQIADATQPLGVDPQVWVTVSAGAAALLVISKAIQAAVDIATGGNAVVVEAPVPDSELPPEGDPEG